MPEPVLVLVQAAGLWLLALLAATVRGLAGAPGGLAGGAGVPVRETARLMRQRRRRTVSADLLLWRVGAWGLLPLAMLMAALVPVGGTPLVDSRVGLVWFNAFDVTVWALVWLTGWGANSAFSLVGGYRFLGLALGYELPLMFALVAPAVAAGSLDLAVIGSAQSGLWYVVWMPVAFAVYCLGVLAFSVWGPMAAPAGADLSGGVLAELSGVDRLLFLGGRHALLAAGAAVAVPLFLAGGAGPWLPGWLWVVLKAAALTGLLAALRDRLPTLRPDKLLELGWVVLLPLVILQDLVVAVVAVVS